MNLYQRIMGWFCFPLEVIWKYHMGERYCHFLKLALVGFIVFWGMFYIDIFFMATNPALNQKIPIDVSETEQVNISLMCIYGFLFVYGVFGVGNLWEIWKRKKAGIRLHSYFIGVPRFLPNRPVVHTLVIPAIDLLIGLGVYQIVRPFGIYLCIAAVFQRWIFKSMFKQERIREMDQQDRVLLQGWKSGQHSANTASIVRIADNGFSPVAADEKEFNERWKKVLK